MVGLIDVGSAAPTLGVTENFALRLLSDCYGLRAKVSRIASETDAVFVVSAGKGGEFFLRVSGSPESLRLQAGVFAYLAEAAPSLPVPRLEATLDGMPIALTDDEGMAVSSLLTSLLPGRLLASAPARVDPHSVIAKLAELDCALAGFSDPLARRRILWDVAHADAVRVHLDAIEDKQLRSLCADALDGWEERAAPVLPSLRGQTIHNDFNPSNILVDQSGAISGIIDFGDLIEAPLVCDLATMLAYLAPKEDLGTALAAPLSVYIELLPLGLSEIRILPDLIAARAAMVVAIASWRSALRPQDRRYLVRNIPVAGRVLAAWAAAGPETLGDWLAERTEARGASR